MDGNIFRDLWKFVALFAVTCFVLGGAFTFVLLLLLRHLSWR
jgi:hypothetical protein